MSDIWKFIILIISIIILLCLTFISVVKIWKKINNAEKLTPDNPPSYVQVIDTIIGDSSIITNRQDDIQKNGTYNQLLTDTNNTYSVYIGYLSGSKNEPVDKSQKFGYSNLDSVPTMKEDDHSDNFNRRPNNGSVSTGIGTDLGEKDKK